ncbi:FAD-linked oxidase C-terminal domain-containing protein [Actinomadura vinacea]|uniref:FAD-linked oxidase C-terminal domain-containing protein n=1 Tax=Actinomadura vinacea TaxID=115336 RepID=A0ABN3IE20_9ACTN
MTGILDALAERLPPGAVVTDPDVVAAHGSDHAPFCASGTALALVRAASTAEVSAVLELASEHGVPVVPQGARSGLTGGANAVEGCLLLSLERMDAILGIDTTEQIARVQPGVVNADLSAAVAGHGLYYPPDPASWEWSTIGGNAATNAGGLCCVKYGVTADFVRGLEVVLADGRVVRTGRPTAKGVAGYDLTRLFVGSEGTLGVITEITVGLRPAPEAPLTAVAFFASARAACTTVTELMASTAPRPSMLELMDRASVDVVRRYRDLGFPDDAEAMLIMQSDRGAGLAPGDLDRFAGLAAAHGGDALVAADAAEGELLLEARRSLAIALERAGSFLSEDVCVPRAALADLMEGVAAISARHGLAITCTGHAGDGNMHPTVLFDADDPDQVARSARAFDEIMELGLALGGTISGEHGIGLVKRDWLETELGAVSLDLHRGIKDLLDPKGILNPGKVITMEGRRR